MRRSCNGSTRALHPIYKVQKYGNKQCDLSEGLWLIYDQLLIDLLLQEVEVKHYPILFMGPRSDASERDDWRVVLFR